VHPIARIGPSPFMTDDVLRQHLTHKAVADVQHCAHAFSPTGCNKISSCGPTNSILNCRPT
jgi:hypothetical protein